MTVPVAVVCTFPSPKSHAQEVIGPPPMVEVLVNVTVFPTQDGKALVVKLATGFANTVTVAVFVLLEPGLDATKVTVYVPGVEYTALGFCEKEVLLFPKFHDHIVGEPPERSLKLTFNGAQPEGGVDEKLAVT